MSERPIIFSGPMVRSIIEGSKTQTRRVVKQCKQFTEAGVAGPHDAYNAMMSADYSHARFLVAGDMGYTEPVYCPYGQPGDRLWVRETWRPEELASGNDVIRFRADQSFKGIPATQDAANKWVSASWRDGEGHDNWRWRPSIHMPRWASRITLEITGVRVERLQEITPDDCRAEGEPLANTDIGVRYGFGQLWNSINAARGHSWDSNPWVWVVEFKRVEGGAQ